MKLNKRYLYVSVLWGLTILISSCGEDRSHEYFERIEVTSWVYEEMKDWYYWESTMPSETSANFLANTESFFKSLLSSSDKFSYIESIEESEDRTRSIAYTSYSYGFDFALLEFKIPSRGTLYAALVLYVAPDSPASEAELKRGDLITSVKGVNLTLLNSPLLYGAESMSIGLGEFDQEEAQLITTQTKTLGSARTIEDNPIFLHKTLQHDGKSIGYLVYNHFTGGPNDSSTGNYNNELLQIATGFVQQGVNELILDLRYNNGGYVYCAQILSTILAPARSLQEPLGYMEYNENHPELTGYIPFISDIAQQGANLDLNTLYVITGSMTASASEMVINCLKSYMDVVLVGQKTVGKNVGSISITDPNREYPWILHPIVCRIYNADADKSSDYSSGFTPDYLINEFDTKYLNTIKELGDKEELLLKTTLSIIDGTYEPEEEEEETPRSSYVSSSIERKATAIRMR